MLATVYAVGVLNFSTYKYINMNKIADPIIPLTITELSALSISPAKDF
jgi:hypothetical protein